MASSSCSTTKTVLPMSRRCRRVSIKRSLSRWCKPIEGSSSTYMTPVNPEPICDAKRIRWDSPPDKVSADRSSERYSKPTLFKKVRRLTISLAIRSPISCLLPSSCRSVNHFKACFRVQPDTVQIGTSSWRLPSRTERASTLRRVPVHVGQV